MPRSDFSTEATRPAPGVTCAPATRKRRRPAAPPAPPGKTSAKSKCSPPRDSSRRPGRPSSGKTPSRVSAGGSVFTPVRVPATAGNSTMPSPSIRSSASWPTRRSATISNRFGNGSPRALKRWPLRGQAPRDWRRPGFLRSWVTPAISSRRPPRPEASCAGGFRSTGCLLRPCGGRSPRSRRRASGSTRAGPSRPIS